MTAQIPFTPAGQMPDDLLETWAANLQLEDVTLAPFMPARLPAPAPGDAPPSDAKTARLNQLIACAQGNRVRIKL